MFPQIPRLGELAARDEPTIELVPSAGTWPGQSAQANFREGDNDLDRTAAAMDNILHMMEALPCWGNLGSHTTITTRTGPRDP